VQQKLSAAKAQHARLVVQQLGDACAEIVLNKYQAAIPEQLPEDGEILRQISVWLARTKQSFPEELADAIGHDRQTSGWEKTLWQIAVPRKLSQRGSQRARDLRNRIDSLEQNDLPNARADIVLAQYEDIIPQRLPENRDALKALSERLESLKQSYLMDLAEATGRSQDSPASRRRNVLKPLYEDRIERARLLLKEIKAVQRAATKALRNSGVKEPEGTTRPETERRSRAPVGKQAPLIRRSWLCARLYRGVLKGPWELLRGLIWKSAA
jgi:hypothetical protein